MSQDPRCKKHYSASQQVQYLLEETLSRCCSSAGLDKSNTAALLLLRYNLQLQLLEHSQLTHTWHLADVSQHLHKQQQQTSNSQSAA